MVSKKDKSVNNSFITIQARITSHERLWDVEVIGNSRLNNSTKEVAMQIPV